MRFPIQSVILLLCAGCVAVPVNDKKAAKIIPGQTTKSELLALCGKPEFSGYIVTTNGRSEKLTWIYQRSSEAANIVLGVRAPDAESIHVYIGTNGVVEAVETGRTQ